MTAVHRQECRVNTRACLLLVICAGLTAGVVAADPKVSESGEPSAQPSAGAHPQVVGQSQPVAPAGPSTMSGKPDPDAKPDEIAPLPVTATAQPLASKPARKTLVDDTVTDAQLKQILRKGYEPERQARGNEVYYCRREHDLGSRFETKVCRTAARILQDEQQGKEATTNVERTDGNRPLK